MNFDEHLILRSRYICLIQRSNVYFPVFIGFYLNFNHYSNRHARDRLVRIFKSRFSFKSSFFRPLQSWLRGLFWKLLESFSFPVGCFSLKIGCNGQMSLFRNLRQFAPVSFEINRNVSVDRTLGCHPRDFVASLLEQSFFVFCISSWKEVSLHLLKSSIFYQRVSE